MTTKLAVSIRFGVYAYDGEFYAWYMIEDDGPRISRPFATREEAQVHNRQAAASVKAELESKGMKTQVLDKGSRERN